MTEVENFDDHIRKEFGNYTPEVSPHIWERIVAEREKRRPVGFWFTLFADKRVLLLAGLILVAVVGGGIFVFHSSTSFNTIKSSKNNLTIVTNKNTVENDKNVSSEKIENKRNNISTTNKNEVSKTSLNRPEKKEITVNDITFADKISSSVAIGKISQSTSKVKRIFSHSGKLYSSSATNKPSTFDINKEEAIIDKSNKKISITGNENISNNNTILSSKDKQTQDDNNSIEKYLQNRFLNGVEKISLNTSNGDISLNKKNIPAINLPECPTIEKDAAANKHYLEVYIGPDYDIRSLTDTANSVYLQKRKASTSFTSGFSAGVRYTRVFTNGMSLRGALNYSQINERFSFVQANVVQTTYIIDPNTGDTTGSYTVRGTRYLTTYNHYRSIDIPLTIGYEFGNGKLHTNINTGIIANIYSWQQGNILDTNYQPVDITTGKGSSFYQFKTNVGFGAMGGVSFYYKLTDQMHILAEPYIRYNFQPISTNNLTLREKYTTIGLRLGLRFDLP